MNALLEMLFPKCTVESFYLNNQTLTIEACRNKESANCPECQEASSRIHSTYIRRPQDLPLCGCFVRLHLRVRRFRCFNRACSKCTFAEQWGNWLKPHAQKTSRIITALYHVAQVAGGEGGCRLLSHLNMKASGSTLIRMIRGYPQANQPPPQIIGIDDWSIRKGRTYGTIIVDLERGVPIDLLPDRMADTVTDWLQNKKSVQIVARDRSPEYAKGIQRGAPEATQIADRWHLLLNLYQMVERFIRQIYKHLRKLQITTWPDENSVSEKRGPYLRTEEEMIYSQQSRSQRIALFEEIQTRKNKGESITSISKSLSLHRETIRTFFYAEQFPERSNRPSSPSILDPYIPHLEKRWSEGCEDARALWREIKAVGYPGSYRTVNKWLRPRRRKPSRFTTKGALETCAWISGINKGKNCFPSVKKIARLLVQENDNLEDNEKQFIIELQQNKSIAKLYPLLQEFQAMIRTRAAERLDNWLKKSNKSGIPRLKTFAEGIQKDYSAVRNALEYPWSNGPTEGHINRLKLIKRQMFGRAKLDLLKRKVLYSSQVH